MFVGKLMVFTAAVEGGFAWLAVVAILITVASVFYYLRWIAPAAGPSSRCSQQADRLSAGGGGGPGRSGPTRTLRSS